MNTRELAIHLGVDHEDVIDELGEIGLDIKGLVDGCYELDRPLMLIVAAMLDPNFLDSLQVFNDALTQHYPNCIMLENESTH